MRYNLEKALFGVLFYLGKLPIDFMRDIYYNKCVT